MLLFVCVHACVYVYRSMRTCVYLCESTCVCMYMYAMCMYVCVVCVYACVSLEVRKDVKCLESGSTCKAPVAGARKLLRSSVGAVLDINR